MKIVCENARQDRHLMVIPSRARTFAITCEPATLEMPVGVCLCIQPTVARKTGDLLTVTLLGG